MIVIIGSFAAGACMAYVIGYIHGATDGADEMVRRGKP
jgi:hypothetical protein